MNSQDVYDEVLKIFKQGNGVEGNYGLWKRVIKMKEELKKQVDSTENLGSKNKVLLVTHFNVM